MELRNLPFILVGGLHRAIYRVSGGRILGGVVGMKVIELQTVGAKSGKTRSAMLTVPVTFEGQDVIVASKGGDDRHPAWFHNLVANPEVKVTVKGKTTTKTARVATPTERADLWPKVKTSYKGYAGYEKRTEREIPLVILQG
jgi:deazaflavin-dependent oxidoreductase (nitroreductase family)